MPVGAPGDRDHGLYRQVTRRCVTPPQARAGPGQLRRQAWRQCRCPSGATVTAGQLTRLGTRRLCPAGPRVKLPPGAAVPDLPRVLLRNPGGKRRRNRHARALPADAALAVVAGRSGRRRARGEHDRACRAGSRRDREARRREHHPVPRWPARAVAGFSAPSVACVGQGAAGPGRAADPRRVASLRGERVRPPLPGLHRAGELVLRVLRVGRRRPVPGLGRDRPVPDRTRHPRPAGAVARHLQRTGAAGPAAGPRDAGRVRRPLGSRVQPGRVPCPRREVGPPAPCPDGRALDVGQGGAEQARPAGRLVGRPLRCRGQRAGAAAGRRVARG